MKSQALYAVVDIGSGAVRMKILQKAGKDKLREIENLEHPVMLGHEVFTTGKLSLNGMQALSDILAKFSQLLREYRVAAPRFFATTALREAENRSLILDFIKIHNNIQIEVLDEGEEKDYIYASVLRRLPALPDVVVQNALVAYIGTGTVGLSLLENNKLSLSLNLAIGSKRLLDILGEMTEDSNNFSQLMDEYIVSVTRHLTQHFAGTRPGSFVAVCSELDLLAGLLGARGTNEIASISRKAFFDFYAGLRGGNARQIAQRFEIKEEQASSMYTAVAICYTLFSLTTAKNILIPAFNFCDFLLQDMLQKGLAGRQKFLYEHSIAQAKRLAERYHCEKQHYRAVVSFACAIHDAIKKQHGLPARMRVILECAAILHEAGNFVSTRASHIDAYFLLRSTYIIGFSSRESNLLACVVRVSGSEWDRETDNVYRYLPEADKLIVSKLAAIIRLSNTLGTGNQNKANKLRATLKNNQLRLRIDELGVSPLERWAFAGESRFFEDVFGIETYLSEK